LPEQKEKVVYTCDVDFTKTLTKKERGSAFSKFLSFVEENKESLPAKTSSRKRRKQIILDSENFFLTISFGKKLAISAMINDPNKNKADVNEIGNKISSYINAILGEKAKGATVTSLLTFRSGKAANLAKKLVGESKVAKISDFLQEMIQPISIAFEYAMGEKAFFLSHSTYNETTTRLIGSHIVYKNRLPFNLIEKEIDELDHSTRIMKKLIEMEL